MIRNVARSHAYGNSLIDPEDVEAFILLRWCEDYDRVSPFVGDEDKLGHVLVELRSWALQYVRNSYRDVKAARRNDQSFYSVAQITDALPIIEDPESWSLTTPAGNSELRSKIDPAHGNTALAMYSDMRRAFESLPFEDRSVLRMRYVQGLSAAEVASRLGLARSGVSMRVTRAVERMQSFLGGKPGQSAGTGRRALSNAAAQVRTRVGYEGD